MPTQPPTHPDETLSSHESKLLDEALGKELPALLLRSNTRIDTGRWLGRSRLWLCVTDTQLLLFAASKRRYLQQYPLSDCRAEYCHTSGALLLQPSDHWRFNTIALAPTDGLKVLQHLKTANTPNQPTPDTEPTGA